MIPFRHGKGIASIPKDAAWGSDSEVLIKKKGV
jgi:hypothetical protein